jgi:hypothetical protein
LLDKERVRYRSTVAQGLEYLDRAYQRQDVFLHDLMKPVLAHKEIGEKNYRALEEYLDLLIRTFDMAEEAGMLPVVLHMNNLRPMYEKWPHGEQAKWWTHAERFDARTATRRRTAARSRGAVASLPRRLVSTPSLSSLSNSSSSSQRGVPSGHSSHAAWGPACARRHTRWRSATSSRRCPWSRGW